MCAKSSFTTSCLEFDDIMCVLNIRFRLPVSLCRGVAIRVVCWAAGGEGMLVFESRLLMRV